MDEARGGVLFHNKPRLVDGGGGGSSSLGRGGGHKHPLRWGGGVGGRRVCGWGGGYPTNLPKSILPLSLRRNILEQPPTTPENCEGADEATGGYTGTTGGEGGRSL